MTDQQNSPALENAAAVPAPAPAKKSRRKWLIGTGLVAALGIGGAVAAQSFDRPFFHHGMMGEGRGGGMMGGHGGRRGAMNMDPARMADMADRGVRHMAVEIDATADQQEKLRAIVRDLVKDVAPLRAGHDAMAERARALLTAPTFDRAEIEKFRAEQAGKMDEASKRVTKAIGDAAEVLTPEQRRKLSDQMRPGAGPFWRRG